HLLEATAQLADVLLRACPHLTIFTSSRERLAVPGEQVYHVPAMAVPDITQRISAAELMAFESARLFVERALAVLPGFAVTDANAPALAELCHRLDGIPFALELAAARVRAMSVEQIVARLNDLFRLLTGGSRTASPRHQTLRSMIDWSYGLLTEPEQTLLRRLCLFMGSCTLEEIEGVCCGGVGEAWEILDLLTSLVDKNLVVFEDTGEEGRYRLLETVHVYAREKLEESGEAEEIRNRFRCYFRELAAQAEVGLRTEAQTLWLRRLDQELDNLRAACEEPPVDETGLFIAEALWQFWTIRGYYSVGRSYLDSASEGDYAPGLRARALRAAAVLASLQGDDAGAAALANACIAIVPPEDLSTRVRGEHLLGWTLRNSDPERASQVLESSYELAKSTQDAWLIGATAIPWGGYLLFQGRFTEAVGVLNAGMDYARRAGDRWLIGNTLFYLGIARAQTQDTEGMKETLRESLLIHRELGDRNSIAVVLNSLGMMAIRQGDFAAARTYLRECLILHQALSNRACIGTLSRWGVLAAASGQPTRAATLFGAFEALSRAESVEMPPPALAMIADTLAQTRSALESSAFEAAYQAGSHLLLSDAVSYALEETP
ncbi:MAG TPA: tetratricopeptide repeat protein, partial [Chthonomonadaceae bacterium]|nr:tetratricopeptide repeat protein [Chthonomonadaceae bacterium]